MTRAGGAAQAVAAVAVQGRARPAAGGCARRATSITAPRAAPRWAVAALLAVITGVGAFLRLWQISRTGLNSDEAVYAGQAASIAGDAALRPFFPVFRAHPLLFHSILSVVYAVDVSDTIGRVVAACFGIATIPLVYLTGARLYRRRTGLLAAALIAVMPYHVVVSRQILLDGPMTFFATLTLYLIVRYATSGAATWLYAAGAALGLTFLAKETGITILGATYAFFALSASVQVRARHVVVALSVAFAVMLSYPVAAALSAHTHTEQSFLVWQLFRRSNHDLAFYPSTIVDAVGPLLVATAAAGLWAMRRTASWREVLLASWIVVPATFFELWPVKGFPYLLPITVPFALLAARSLVLALDVAGGRLRWAVSALIAVVLGSLVGASWARIDPSPAGTFLAGSGGVPGGREAGRWIQHHVPPGAQMLAIGPSMANILEFYGHRQVFGLSVSPNPLHRNPVYVAVNNADSKIRNSAIQYVVWDAYSAGRSEHFAERLLRYRDRYHGRLAHVASIALPVRGGGVATRPVIAIWEVHP